MTKEYVHMTWVYLIILVFAALTLYFLYHDCRKNKIPKNAFILVSVLEMAAMIVLAVLLIRSL